MQTANDPSKFEIEFAGRTVYFEVSLCSYMHKGYGLQFSASLQANCPNIGVVFINDRSFDCYGVPKKRVVSRAKKLAAAWVEDLNNRQALVDAQDKLQSYTKLAREAQQEERRNREIQTAAMKRRGFTHMVHAIIHRNSGDDLVRQVFVVGNPTNDTIRKIMRGSVVKDSFSVVAL